MFHSQDQTSQLNCNFPYEYTTAKLVLGCLSHYHLYFNGVHSHHTVLTQNQSHVTTDGQSVCLDVEPLLVLMTRCLLLFDDYCCVFVGRPL
jgi:hypothetical protein